MYQKRAVVVGMLVVVGAFGGITVARANPSGHCTGSNRECVIEAATTYLDALVSHDASDVRLAEDAKRTENGSDTGSNAAEIREGLEAPIMHVITGIRDIRWFVDTATGDATAFYLLDTSTPGAQTVQTTTTHIAERFRVEHGLITEIEAIFWIAPGTEPGSSGWEEES